MSEWKEYKLGELTELITKGTTPSSLRGRFVDKGINYIKSEAVGHDGRLDKSTFVFIDEEMHQKLKRSQLAKDDILFSMAGIYLGKSAMVPEDVLPANTNQALAIIRLNKNKANPKFIHYYLRQRSVVDFVNNMSGQSAQPNINFEEIKSIDILLPEITEQILIASILNSLDDKIDLLHSQNKTLEQLAETLFREWFVEEAEESWEVGKISDYTKHIQYGFTQSASSENIGPKFLRITDIQGGNVNWESVPYCSTNETEFSKYELKTGDMVIARTGASTGENLYIYKPEKAIFASYLIRIQFSNPSFARYVSMHLRSSDYFRYIEGILSGSAQPNANATELTSFEIVVPSEEKLNSFFKIVSEFDEKKYFNQTQIQTLTQLRNTLLPKLMNGEVKVK